MLNVVRVEEKWVLRDEREKLGLTQQQVADKAGIRLQKYQRFENSERNLSSAAFYTACNVMKALGLDLTKYRKGEYVFGDEVKIENGKLKRVNSNLPETISE